MVSPGRIEALCNQNPPVLTGIDFVWVDPADHRNLAVFFVVEPDILVRPVDETATEFTATITGNEDASTIAVASTTWVTRLDASGDPRLTLELTTETEGDFQFYTLELTDTPGDGGDQRLDVFCDEIVFSFKQPCPSPFDCVVEKECPPIDDLDVPVDYLARDFESFRRALLADAEARYPQWDAKVPADFGGMVSELFAALGDELSYVQDRFQREGYLSTLTQRRSFEGLARLVDYRLDPGQAATALVVMRAPGAGAIVDVPSGARLWAEEGDRDPVPFEVGESIEQIVSGLPEWPVHPLWADIPVYVPDATEPCLPIGARELYLANANLFAPPLPPDVVAADIGGYWEGRTLLVETRPTDPLAPVRRHLVTLDEPVEQFDDPLSGAGPLLRLHWREADALPFELDQTSAFVSANLVPVRAGFTVQEPFVVGETDDPALTPFPRTIERQGPLERVDRGVVHRFTLSATVAGGLGWQTLTDDAGAVSYEPDAHLVQLDPDAGNAVVAEWEVGADGLAGGPTDERAVVESGHYGVVSRGERNGVPYAHRDYIDDRGFTLRFGAGTFGRSPVRGDVYEVSYRTGPGAGANVAESTIAVSEGPDGYPPPLHPMPAAIESAENPFAVVDGRDPQSLELARRIAPAAYKALVFRAVRDEDYREQVERLDWVQQARATTRSTGSWSSTFVTADPVGAFEIDPERWAEMSALLSAVRQVGRCVIPRQPVYLPLDLKVAVCIAEHAAFGHVAEAVVDALSPDGGFFAADRFSFGDSLVLAALEAAIACVPGVTAVRTIQVRQRGFTDFEDFTAAEIPIPANRILKVENDPNRPGQGSVRVYLESIPALEGV